MAAVKTLRSILNELRLASPNGSIKDSLASQYVIAQFRKYQTTDEQLCKEKDEMLFLGQTYQCYLESMRNYKRINDDYKGAGERSVKDTASLVGFKLPHDPK
jgi:hypothetical protein